MSETTLKVRTQADIEALRNYTREIERARRATLDLQNVAAHTQQGGRTGVAQGTTGGAPGGAPAGSLPPTPPHPHERQQAAVRGSWAAADRRPVGYYRPDDDVSGYDMRQVAPPRSWAQRFAGTPGQGGGRLQQAMAGARSFIGQSAATAIGVGLGSSISGFFLQSGQKYMELDKILTHLGARFREAGREAGFFGTSLGFTVAEGSRLVELLGSQTNTIDRGQVQRFLGFARARGMDPSAAMQHFGRLERLTSSSISDSQIASLVGRAQSAQMGQGRFPEYMQALEQLGEAQFRATGHVDLRSASGLQALPGAIYGSGSDPRAQGMAGVDFINRLQGVMTSAGPMRTYLMRAMGFGREGGPSYIEMRKRLEAGVFGEEGAENLADLFGSFRAQGLSRGAQFRALESVAGDSLKAYEIEAIVNSLGAEGGVGRLRGALAGDAQARNNFLESLDPQARAAFEKMGFAGMGQRHVGLGSRFEVQGEAMQMMVGRTVAEVMVDTRETLVNLAGGLRQILGMDLHGLITGLTGAIVSASEKIERFNPPMTTGEAVGQLQRFGGGLAGVAGEYGHGAGLAMYGAVLSRSLLGSYDPFMDPLYKQRPEWFTTFNAGMGAGAP